MLPQTLNHNEMYVEKETIKNVILRCKLIPLNVFKKTGKRPSQKPLKFMGKSCLNWPEVKKVQFFQQKGGWLLNHLYGLLTAITKRDLIA
jgi:hypothetical protein